MAVLDFLINEDQIQEQREISDEIARDTFNPDILNPQLHEAQNLAQEGINDALVRDRILDSLFDGLTVGNMSRNLGGGRALGFLEKLSQQKSDSLANAETTIGLEEERAKREGRGKVAQIQSKQKEISAQRDAEIKKNRALAEAEANNRKKKLGSVVGQTVGTVAGGFLGPLGATLGGAAGGAIFGGGSGAISGAASGVSASVIRNMLDPEAENITLDDIFNLFNSGLGDEAGSTASSLGDMFKESASSPIDKILSPNINL